MKVAPAEVSVRIRRISIEQGVKARGVEHAIADAVASNLSRAAKPGLPAFGGELAASIGRQIADGIREARHGR